MVRPPADRRKGPDLWLKLLSWLGLLSGVSLVTALFIAAVAKPQVETFFDRFYNLHLRRSWDMELMQYIFYLLLLCLASSVGGLVINSRRRRRKADYTRAWLIVTLGVSLFGLGCYFVLATH